MERLPANLQKKLVRAALRFNCCCFSHLVNNFNLTFYKVIVLLISTLMAIYIGHAYSLEKILKSLSWFFIIISVACLAFVIFLPDIGIMRDPFYKGAWSGIFWHRNYMGCFMALGASIYLINILKSQKRLTVAFAIDIVMLGITLFLLVKSKSATGILTGMVLAALVVVFYVWEKVQIILTRVHYYGFLGAAVVAIMFILTKLDFIFGLLGRNTSLTGRVPMWKYLFENLIIQRLWLGYGYGALWHFRGIREEIARQVGWSYEVLIGDNGFIDIQLHLGIIGLAVIFGLIILGFIHGKRYLLQQRTLESAFPILLLVFVLVANISLSLILESETLVWIVSVAVIISVQNRFQKQPE